jgi:hypothetical protein
VDGFDAAPALVLLGALSTALLGRGGYFATEQWAIGVFLAVAGALAVSVAPLSRADLHGSLVPWLGAVAGWAAVVASLKGSPGNGLAPALLAAGVVVVLAVCRRAGEPTRHTLVQGLVAVALVVAASGWAGVAFGIDGWRWAAQGLWRSSSTLTYPNATAAVLVPVALLVVALLTVEVRSVPLRLAATGLIVGAGATMSRAGLLALVVGLVVLAAVRGARVVAAAVAWPALGAAVALGALVPSSSTSQPTSPWLASLGLAAALAIAAGAVRLAPRVAGGLAAATCTAGMLAVVFTDAADRVASARFSADSSYRLDALRAAWKVVTEHPLTGGGPGMVTLRWTDENGTAGMLRYAHDEYVQVAAELGLVGAALTAAVLVALGRLLWRCRSDSGVTGARWAGGVAATCAFAVHSAFDFIWHLPAVPLLLTTIIGLVTVLPMTTATPGGASSAPESHHSTIPTRKGTR